jgi:hypothetical protein
MVSLEKLSTKGIKSWVLHTYVSLQTQPAVKTQPAVNFGPRWSQRELQCAEVMFPSTSLRFMNFHLWAEPKGLMSERFWGRICLKAHVFFGEYQSTLSTFVGSVSNPSLRWQLQTLPKKWGGISATYHISNSGAFAHRQHCGFWGVFFCDFQITYPCPVESNRFKTYKTIQNLYDKYIQTFWHPQNSSGDCFFF